jgi:competence protein ComEA
MLSVALAAPVLLKGHGTHRKGESAAFLRYSATMVTVRLQGGVPSPGIYRFSDGVGIDAVIKMTGAHYHAGDAVEDIRHAPLMNGDILEFQSAERQQPEIKTAKMKAGEKMLLGIPLHPDTMDSDDWECLPGIGPRLARKIVRDRQINGEFGAIGAVERVPGVGKGKLGTIAKYF